MPHGAECNRARKRRQERSAPPYRDTYCNATLPRFSSVERLRRELLRLVEVAGYYHSLPIRAPSPRHEDGRIHREASYPPQPMRAILEESHDVSDRDGALLRGSTTPPCCARIFGCQGDSCAGDNARRWLTVGFSRKRSIEPRAEDLWYPSPAFNGAFVARFVGRKQGDVDRAGATTASALRVSGRFTAVKSAASTVPASMWRIYHSARKVWLKYHGSVFRRSPSARTCARAGTSGKARTVSGGESSRELMSWARSVTVFHVKQRRIFSAFFSSRVFSGTQVS